MMSGGYASTEQTSYPAPFRYAPVQQLGIDTPHSRDTPLQASQDYYPNQPYQSYEGIYSSPTGNRMERQSRAIETRPLERYEGRYDTKVSRPNKDHNIIVKTRVKGENLPSYGSAVNLKHCVFTTTDAWGRRPLNDTEYGDAYVYDSDARRSGEPMSYSDVAYAQIAKVIKKHGPQYHISNVDKFEIQEFTIEMITNKSTLDAIGHLVKPGDYNEFPQHSTEFNKCMDTPFGKALQHLHQQRYPAREVTSVVIDRSDDKPDASVDAIASMSFIAERR
jgi:hypothetical protein